LWGLDATFTELFKMIKVGGFSSPIYRLHDNGLQISACVSDPWQSVANYPMPPKLFTSKTRLKMNNKFKDKGKFKPKVIRS